MLALAKEIFAAQPFTALLGAELTGIGDDWAEISLGMQQQLQQQHGYAHGGVISYLADNALTFAGGMSLGGDALTSEFKINYVRPARGERLVARASALSVGRRQAVCQCLVYSVAGDEETLAAVAQGTITSLAPRADG
ncbi:MAG TPA: PaaI family thioesterase [Jatrophihabitans sp.]|nr:PaaI family thioesterase [Jatrophihabitans sp.]